LLQRIQNVQNEMIIRQNREFSKLQAVNAKVLAKFSLNLADLGRIDDDNDFEGTDLCFEMIS
jgi:hypothetical protein